MYLKKLRSFCALSSSVKPNTKANLICLPVFQGIATKLDPLLTLLTIPFALTLVAIIELKPPFSIAT